MIDPNAVNESSKIFSSSAFTRAICRMQPVASLNWLCTIEGDARGATASNIFSKSAKLSSCFPELNDARITAKNSVGVGSCAFPFSCCERITSERAATILANFDLFPTEEEVKKSISEQSPFFVDLPSAETAVVMFFGSR
jgi:hypothetical protein